MEKSMILVIDDDLEILKLIKIYLKNEGYHVIKAGDGLEALDILAQTEVRLIILDVMMPRMDGIEACLKIREKKEVPIIMLSAKMEDMDKIHGLSVGADDYLTIHELTLSNTNDLDSFLNLISQSIPVQENTRYMPPTSAAKYIIIFYFEDGQVIRGRLYLDKDFTKLTLDPFQNWSYNGSTDLRTFVRQSLG